MNNPYVWNRINPDLFYGRDELLKDLIGDPPCNPYHSWSSFGVAGGRRMGKTTLLRRVEKDLQNGIQQWRKKGLLVIPIYIDGLALPHPLSAPDIWGLIFCELQSALTDEEQQTKPLDFDNFMEEVKSILCELKEKPRIVVMFDEIERILACEWNYTFLDNFRALINNTPSISEYLTAIFVGAQEMAALRHSVGSPLAGALDWRYLGSFAYEDACRLMQEPIGGQAWPEEFLKYMHRETGGHPMLLQYMMQQICSNRLVTESCPTQLIEQAKEAASDFAKNQYGEFEEWWGKYCSPLAQRIYDRLVNNASNLSREKINTLGNVSEVSSALNILQHVGIASEDEDEDKKTVTYGYSGEMFRRWFDRSGYDPDSVPQETESGIDLDQEGPAASETSPLEALANNSVSIPSSVVEDFLAYYEKKSWNYARFAQLVAQFLAWRVDWAFPAAKLPVLHQYTHRAKSLASLRANFDAKRYDKIAKDCALIQTEDLKKEITDLAGARLIFYFKDDLDRFFVDGIHGNFERWFGTASKDARQISGSKISDGTREEKQGYESYHVPVRIQPAKTEFFQTLRQSDRVAIEGLSCEVQLRTILQHAWAEAEHDLRYKPVLAWGKTIEGGQQEMLDSSASMIYKGEEELSKCKRAFEEQEQDASQSGADNQSDTNNNANNFFAYKDRYSFIDCSLEKAPNIKEYSDIFNLDQEMKEKCRIENYKQEVWKKLQEEKPQFIAAIDYDPLLVRVRAWASESRNLELQPAYYTDQAVTNHQEIIETKICSDKTIDFLSKEGTQGELLDFDKSPMANTLGVSCVVTFENRSAVLAYRSRSVAFGPEQIEGLGSGALEWTELGHWERDSEFWCAGGISRKFEKEIGNGGSPEQFIYLGLARDLQCAGKPQMFFLLNLDEEVFEGSGGIYSQWTTYTPPKILDYNLQTTEFRDLFSLNMDKAKCLVESEHDAISRVTKGAVISDEFRMNLDLALQYLKK